MINKKGKWRKEYGRVSMVVKQVVVRERVLLRCREAVSKVSEDCWYAVGQPPT